MEFIEKKGDMLLNNMDFYISKDGYEEKVKKLIDEYSNKSISVEIKPTDSPDT